MVHLRNPNVEPVGIVNILLFGAVLGLLRMAGSGLAGLTILHWAWNFFTGMIAGWNVSGLSLPSFFVPRRDPFGGFGPESSPILTSVLLVSASYLALRARRRGNPLAALPGTLEEEAIP
jgi:hypothetical protein